MNNINSRVNFFYQSSKIQLKNKTRLKNFIYSLLKKEGKTLTLVNFIFCTDKELKTLNYEYLKHDFFTDILTFDLSEKRGEVIADIFISVERIQDNAKRFNISITKEFHRVIIHGLLHLCGYKDKKKVDIQKIRAAEDKYLAEYFK